MVHIAMVDEDRKKLIVEFYKNSSNKEPVRTWIMGLDKEDRLEIGSDIANIEVNCL